MLLYMEMSQNINKTMRHLKFCYISILTNLLRKSSSIYIYIYYKVEKNFISESFKKIINIVILGIQ